MAAAHSDRAPEQGAAIRSLSWLVILGVLGLLGWRLWVERSFVREVDWFAHPSLWILHVILLVVTFTLLTVGWVVCLRILGNASGGAAAAATWLMSNLGKYIPGKIFMFAGRVELGRRTGVRPAVSVSAMVFEHVMLLIAAMPWVLWLVARGLDLGVDLDLWIVAAALVLIFVVAVRPALVVATVNRLLRAVNRSPLTEVPKVLDSAKLLGLYSVAWAVYGAAGLAVLAAVGRGGAISPGDGIAAFVSAWLVGFASLLTPGGLGVREGVLVLLLASAMPTPAAIVVALVSRLSWTVVELLGVVFGTWIARRMNHPREKSASPSE